MKSIVVREKHSKTKKERHPCFPGSSRGKERSVPQKTQIQEVVMDKAKSYQVIACMTGGGGRGILGGGAGGGKPGIMIVGMLVGVRIVGRLGSLTGTGGGKFAEEAR